MTLGFSKKPDGKIQIMVNAWKIRETRNYGIPLLDFSKAFITDVS
jgi:hypothetical protein